MCILEQFRIQVNNWKTKIEKIVGLEKLFLSVIVSSINTKTAFSCKVLATTTIRLANRRSKSGALSAFNRFSANFTKLNGILMLSLTWARLNSELFRKSMITTSSGLSVSNLIKSFALIRADRSYCKSSNSIPLTSCIIRAQIEHQFYRTNNLTASICSLTNSLGSHSCKTFLRYATLVGVHRYIFCDSITHVSITISGRSENSKMHSLKHEASSVAFNCCNIEIPIKSGYELSPRINLSHK